MGTPPPGYPPKPGQPPPDPPKPCDNITAAVKPVPLQGYAVPKGSDL